MKSELGVLDHFKQSDENWGDVQENCKVTFVSAASIINSLW